MSVLTFPDRARGHSGRARAYPTQTTPLAGKPQKQAVRALLERLGAIHQTTCPCVRIQVQRCHPLERRLMAALKALEHGSSVDEAIEVAGSFGLLGSVEVMQ